MRENVVVVIFEVESEGYQSYMETRNRLIDDNYTILQGGLVKKVASTVSVVDVFSSGVDSTDDTVRGGLIGGVVDAKDVNNNSTMLETVGAKLQDGQSALLLLTQEEDESVLDHRFDKFKTIIIRHDAAAVQVEVDEAKRVEKEMAEEARRKLRAERSADHKQKVEENRAKLKASFEGFKAKFKKS